MGFFLGQDFAIHTISTETCHVNVFARAVVRNIDPQSFLYGPRCAPSVFPSTTLTISI